jgi:hypothetical protein
VVLPVNAPMVPAISFLKLPGNLRLKNEKSSKKTFFSATLFRVNGLTPQSLDLQ